MADNFTVLDADGSEIIIASRDVGGVHTPKRFIADGDDVAFGAKADAAWGGAGDGTLIAIEKASYAKVEAVRALLAGTLTVGLPSGAATAAKQPAPGTAGAASADVITIQGVASMTPLIVGGATSSNPASSSNPVPTALYFSGNSASSGANNADGVATSSTSNKLRVIGTLMQINSSGAEDRARGNTSGLAVLPYGLPSAHWNYAAPSGGFTADGATTIIAAAGSGVRNYVTSIEFAAEALGAATEIVIRDGSGGTVLWRGKIGTAGLSGRDIVFAVPLRGSANTLMEVALLTNPTSGAVYFNAQGYQGV